MSEAAADARWARALAAAGSLGLLPADIHALTPAEIASAARQRGDGRLDTLVRGYYYPACYGRTAGSLSEDEAEMLVAELESGRRPSASAVPARAGAAAVLCPVCGKRPAAQ
jgi:hypothetical protein